MKAHEFAITLSMVMTLAAGISGCSSGNHYDDEDYESYSEPRANPLSNDEITEMNDLSLKSRPLTGSEDARHQELWNKFENGSEGE
jgi:hypothetical protein